MIALGMIGKPAVPGLTEALQDAELVVRKAVAVSLGRIGSDAEAAVGSLTELLTNTPPTDPQALPQPGTAGVVAMEGELRRELLHALGGIGPAAKPVLGEMVKALNDPDAETRIITAIALLRIDPSNSPAAEMLLAIVKQVEAPRLVNRFAQAPDSPLTQALQSPNRVVPSAVANGLAKEDADAPAAIEAIIAAINDPDERVREKAGQVLADVGTAAQDSVDPLAKASRTPAAAERASNVEAPPGPAAPTVPTLCDSLKSDKAGVRRNAAHTLAEFGPEAKEALPALLPLLKDPNISTRVHAAYALTKISEDHTTDVVKVLLDVLKNSGAEEEAFGGAAKVLADLNSSTHQGKRNLC